MISETRQGTGSLRPPMIPPPKLHTEVKAFFRRPQVHANHGEGRHCKEHSQWSGMVGRGGEEDGLRTVECLRGRLLAERVASKAAREEAEQLSKRLNEVERQLAMEIEAMNRAEKRLRGILKKLKSLKVLDVSGPSNGSEASSYSSSPWRSSLRDPEEGKTSSQTQSGESAHLDVDGKAEERRNPLRQEDTGAESTGSTSPAGSTTDQSASRAGGWASLGTSHSQNNGDRSGEEAKEIKGCPKSIGHGEIRTMLNPDPSQEDITTTSDAVACGDEDHGDAGHETDGVDDRLALVPVGIWDGSETAAEHRGGGGGGVEGVLDALRHVKLQLQDMVLGAGRNSFCTQGVIL